MTSPVTRDRETLPVFTDDELSTLALAADPDMAVDDDAVSLREQTHSDVMHLLPEWYMPSSLGGIGQLRGWRRRVVLLVIASFLVITAYGLCNTYGQLRFG
jgi:hypothetical protein